MGMVEQDTIVAISTPVGRGGIGIVRVSGARAREVVGPLVRLRGEWTAGRARVGEIVDLGSGESAEADPCGMTNKKAEDRSRFPSGMTNEKAGGQTGEVRVLDEAVVTWFAGPRSYTGEDVVEIAMHGAPVLLEWVVRRCCEGGAGSVKARLAEPGEFTQRAFLAGRIDLTQAEAVDDLIGSSTIEQARVAARQMGGALSREVSGPKELLVGLIAAMEAGIDFAEDDIDVMAAERIAEKIAEVRGPLAELERSFAYGRVVREGFRLAIVGRPNAGKSSLFNRLVERERAIVTAAPGTTRDLVTETVAIGGIPVELVDTAGLREGMDEAERKGIAKSREAMAEADVVLLVVDSTVGVGEEDRGVMEGYPVIVAWSKRDLVAAGPDDCGVTSQVSESGPGAPSLAEVGTSAVTGEGLEELREAILRAVGGRGGAVGEAGMLTNLRQHQAVTWALAGLEKGLEAVRHDIPHEMVLLDLYAALEGLDALTGVTTNGDVLRLIFSRFCIGK
ncbi:MAG: tRNA uridine-5-carboxymethylaminomethyl(34) synthesis GTPase MnmE [Acidobacteriaceae bacterium]|jgi:tRNA modification GTPase